jgi:hypothetical protein
VVGGGESNRSETINKSHVSAAQQKGRAKKGKVCFKKGILCYSRIDKGVRRSPLCDELLPFLEDVCVACFFAIKPGAEREAVAAKDIAIVGGL